MYSSTYFCENLSFPSSTTSSNHRYISSLGLKGCDILANFFHLSLYIWYPIVVSRIFDVRNNLGCLYCFIYSFGNVDKNYNRNWNRFLFKIALFSVLSLFNSSKRWSVMTFTKTFLAILVLLKNVFGANSLFFTHTVKFISHNQDHLPNSILSNHLYLRNSKKEFISSMVLSISFSLL